MYKCILVVSLLAAACSGGSSDPGTISGEAIQLSYRLTPGNVWRYAVELNQEIGPEGGRAPTTRLDYVLEIRIDGVEPTGIARAALMFHRTSQSTAASKLHDFEQLVTTFAITPSGDITNLQVHGPEGQDAPSSRALIEQMLLPFRLSARPTRLNEPWRYTQAIPTVLMGLKVPAIFQVSTDAWLTHYDATGAQIQVASETTLPQQTANLGAHTPWRGPVQISSRGHAAVSLSFDRVKGRIDSLDGTTRSKLEIVSGGDRMVVNNTVVLKMKLRNELASR